jgi:hypothetical protein
MLPPVIHILNGEILLYNHSSDECNTRQRRYKAMLAEGEPVFFGLFILFAALVLLGIAQNQGLISVL